MLPAVAAAHQAEQVQTNRLCGFQLIALVPSATPASQTAPAETTHTRRWRFSGQ
jgi:hypothetical protein